jgi:prephenate dehydrogenase
MIPPFARIGIVGLGLIGGSIAQGIRRTWPDVSVMGVDQPDVAETACRLGVISEARAALGELREAELIVLATPVPQITELLAAARRVRLDAIVTDVGSTKRQIMAAAGADLTFIGGHPIAGSAHAGLHHARPDLFEGRPWLLVPADAPEPAIDRLEQLVEGLGAIPRRTNAETHDRVMAYVSHLPQLLANVLMSTAGAAVGEDGIAISGRGFADMTRLASSPGDVWRGIVATNADFIAEAASALIAMLPATPDQLADSARIEECFRQANRWLEIMNTTRSR